MERAEAAKIPVFTRTIIKQFETCCERLAVCAAKYTPIVFKAGQIGATSYHELNKLLDPLQNTKMERKETLRANV